MTRAELLAGLEVERFTRVRPPVFSRKARVEIPTDVTPEQAALNRRVLAEAINCAVVPLEGVA